MDHKLVNGNRFDVAILNPSESPKVRIEKHVVGTRGLRAHMVNHFFDHSTSRLHVYEYPDIDKIEIMTRNEWEGRAR